MPADEREIMRDWLVRHQHDYDEFQAQVHLGQGLILGDDFDAVTRRQAQVSTQKRADLVAIQTTSVCLIEFKSRIGSRAIGQLLIYRDLWNTEHPERPVGLLLAVGRTADPDIYKLLPAYGITVELISAAATLA